MARNATRKVERTATETRKRAAEPPPPSRRDSNRDLVEQIVVAFILAFLVRGFEAEAFVIPTGSMAPTLMGQHKEIECPQCGHVYRVNASDEVEGRAPSRVVAGTCGNCRYRAKLAEAPSFKGDRILVMKFLYHLPFLPGGGGPDRWDVVVFKYPEDPETNYIKRLVGLPGEELRVYFGDILTRPLDSDEPFRLRRKPLEHQQSMQMNVWDDTHRPKALADLPEWARWRARTPATWTEDSPGTFHSNPAARADLRYANLVPDPQQWAAILAGKTPATAPRPSLITDFYAYNSAVLDPQFYSDDWFQPHWVGDLTVALDLLPTSAEGTVRIELIEGGIDNQCEIDLATGKATLLHAGQPLGEPADTGIRAGVAAHVMFANVDDRLTLWVDGKTPFGDGLEYDDGTGIHPAPTARDLDPVGVTTEKADVRVSGLVVKRDIYYTQVPGSSDYQGLIPWTAGSSADERAVESFNLLSDPAQFELLGTLGHKDYAIRPGHYMMMGDNSPRSRDSRGWHQEDQTDRGGWDPVLRESWEVPENLLIGKAFYVYWPHGKPFGPDVRLGQNFSVPFRPYVERMKWIK